MKKALFFVFFTVISVYSLGCTNTSGRACTEIGCSDGYSLTLNHSTWAAGAYQFEIDIDNQRYTCSVTLPFSSCNIHNPCNSDKVSLGLSGCALPSAQHGISNIVTSVIDFAQMKVKISTGTNVLLEQSFSPQFKTSQPNGPGCEPICRNASDTVQF